MSAIIAQVCECGHLQDRHEQEEDKSYCLGGAGTGAVCPCTKFKLATRVREGVFQVTWVCPHCGLEQHGDRKLVSRCKACGREVTLVERMRVKKDKPTAILSCQDGSCGSCDYCLGRRR